MTRAGPTTVSVRNCAREREMFNIACGLFDGAKTRFSVRGSTFLCSAALDEGLTVQGVGYIDCTLHAAQVREREKERSSK